MFKKKKVYHNVQSRFITSIIPQILHHEWILEGNVLTQRNHEEVRPESFVQHTVVFLHGLLGNGKNLRAPAKRITALDPSIGVLNLDLRGHGLSHLHRSTSSHATPTCKPITIHDCAQDVIHTVQHLGLTSSKSPVACVGHSFGGRVALSYHHSLLLDKNTNHDIHPPNHCWILDSVPGAVNSSVASVIHALDSMLPLTIQSKQELVTILTEEKKLTSAIAMWMTTNLRKGNATTNPWEFTFDLNLAKEVLNDFPKQDFMKLLSDIVVTSAKGDEQLSSRVHLVLAGLNPDWTPEILTALQGIQKKSNRLDLVTLKNANHWVHVDDLDGLVDAMKDDLI
jgi:pimeloyl-ACP methyl ester carboxylesterase